MSRRNGRARVTFAVGDLRDWRPTSRSTSSSRTPPSSGCPGHLDLLPGLVDAVRPGGWFAFQVPGNSADPVHTALPTCADLDRWRGRFEGRDRGPVGRRGAATYLERLAALGCAVDAWETTYLQVLDRRDAVLRWISGTGLRPVPRAWPSAEDREAFLASTGAGRRVAYPRRPCGTVLPFRRIFVVAQVGAGRRDDRPACWGCTTFSWPRRAAPRTCCAGSTARPRHDRGAEAAGARRLAAAPGSAAGAVELHLGIEDDFRPAGKAHPGLLVADLPAYVDRLAAHCVPVEWDDAFPGFRRCYLRDPHGNRLELLEPLPA